MKDKNGYQATHCYKQYTITDLDYEEKRVVNTANLQKTMDDLIEIHPQGNVQSCHVCDELQKAESAVSLIYSWKRGGPYFKV